MQIFLHWIDKTNEWVGKIAAWLVLPLVLFIALGGGYALLYGTHVSVDVIVTRLSLRGRALIDLITGPVFFAAICLLLWQVLLYTLNSVLIREHYTSTWSPPICPGKVLMAVGILFLLLQGIAKWIRDLMVVLHKEGANN